MNLRTRLLLGYGYMMVLLLLTAGSAAFGFFTISEAIDRILRENFKSVTAAVDMLDALEQQNVLAMRAMGRGGVEPEHFAEADRAFEEAMELARPNATITGEALQLADVQRHFDEFRAGRDEALHRKEMGEPLELLSLQVFPLILDVREEVSALLELNHQAIIEADAAARATALRTAGWLGLLVTVALLSMVFLARALQRKILVRLQELTDVAQALLTGDLQRRFEVGASDELGVMARQLNTALDARDEMQAEMRGRINQQNQLVLGLLEAREGPLLLLGLDGRLIAESGQGLERAELETLQGWLVENRVELLRKFREAGEVVVTAAEVGHQVRLLAAQGRRPVGWLVQIAGA